MRSRRTANEQAAEVARRRLELLSAELAAIRPDPVQPPSHSGRDGSGEPPASGVSEVAAGDVGVVARGRPGRHASRPVGRATLLGGWLEDRLPPSLQGRVRIGAAHLAALAVLVAAVMAALAWNAVRAGDPGDLVPARSVTDGPPALVTPAVPAGLPSQPGSVPPGTASPSGSPSAEVVVDVAGKVRRPGIVRLPVGSRVVDAVEAAGGPRRGVDLSSLNLARVLVDGEQVVVGVPAPGGVAASAASSPGTVGGPPGALVNINTAGQTELETLPGIGPVTAEAILQWRTDNGAFSAVDELMEVSGIGEATLADMAPFVTV